jgi:hypothetical protein
MYFERPSSFSSSVSFSRPIDNGELLSRSFTETSTAEPSWSRANLRQSIIDALEAAIAPAGPVDPFDVQTPVTEPTQLYVHGAGDAKDIDANDVFQGGLGDCYFMAALAGIAEKDPEAIRQMIHENRDASGNVVSYTVDLYKRDENGRLVKAPQTVDAREFSQSAAGFGDKDAAGNQELWVRIVEKAYAQLNGGYSKIGKGGGAGGALEALTGYSVEGRDPRNYSFEQLQADVAAGRPVCFLTPDTQDAAGNPINPGKADLLNGQGLKADHYYYATETKVEDGKQMVRLMNPWGHTHPGADKDGWIAYDDLVDKRLAEWVDVGVSMSPIARAVRKAVESISIFAKA